MEGVRAVGFEDRVIEVACEVVRMLGAGHKVQRGMVARVSGCKITKGIVRSEGLFPLQFFAEDTAANSSGGDPGDVKTPAVQVTRM